MSKVSKFSLLLAGLFAVSVVVIRIILSGWVGWMWVPLGAATGLFLFAVIRDWRLMLEFFTLRTTKHGLNMGVLILTMVVFLVAVNFLAVTKDKTWDFTAEGLNSLSEQSVMAAKNLKADTDFLFLYRKGQGDENIRKQVSELVGRYTEASPRAHLKVYNVLERPDLAQKYEYSSGPYAFFVVQAAADGKAERHAKIELPTEEEITRTLISFGREKKKTVYFVSGHGEQDFKKTGLDSISQFKTDLENSYELKSLELSKDPKVPLDADVVIIAGPRQAYLPSEVEALREFAKRGGHMFIALDPDAAHGLASLTKTFGIEYQNNFLLDNRTTAGEIGVVAHQFSLTADVTKPLQNGFAVFLLASGLKRAPDAPNDFVIDEIVRTDDHPLATDNLAEDKGVRIPGPHTVAILSKGKLSGSEKEFEVIVIGDSDFLRDTLYRTNLNRDLAMNAAASLAKDADLVSIRPKLPKGTTLEMSPMQQMLLLFGFLIPIVLGLFSTSFILWWRRKAA
jgi:ABC-type uncharacterized transport system involved in gliding motility auxiliary subunit